MFDKSNIKLVLYQLPIYFILLFDTDIHFLILLALIPLALITGFYINQYSKVQIRIEILVGVIVSVCSPILSLNIYWLLLAMLIYNLFRNVDIFDKVILKIPKQFHFIKEIIVGFLVNFVVSIIFMAWKILPLLILFYKKGT